MSHETIRAHTPHKFKSHRPLSVFLTVLLLISFRACPSWAQDSASVSAKSAWPSVKAVDAQPLLAQIGRLREAMKFVGSPLSPKTAKELAQLTTSQPAGVVTKEVQRILDPHCLAGVTLDKSGKVTAVVGRRKPELLQEGWRNFLVKVVNAGELETQLAVLSPNSGDKPGAPAGEADKRWMEVSMFDGRPMNPRLSGLKLEYRILQVYSSKAGTNQGSLSFRAVGDVFAGEKGPALIQEWTFEKGLEGWQGTQEAVLEKGVVTLKSKTGPTFLQRIAPQPNASGRLTLTFWMKAPVRGRRTTGTVLWSNGPVGKGQIGQTRFSIKDANAREYRVTLDAKNLTGIRIAVPNGAAIHWIRLARFTKQKVSPAAIKTAFHTVPATKVTLRVLDEKLRPTTAAFHIVDQKGRVYPTQSKRLAPDFFFHPQVYRSDGETLALPPGEYTIRCRRGPESIPTSKKLTVGAKPLMLDYRVQRWVDPAKHGWYSGDHHIHAAGCAHYQNPTQGVHATDMARHCMGEDLKVGCNLTWGPCFDYQKQFFTGKVAAESKYPYLLRYDVEVSGFGSHVSGHLCLLRLKEQIYPGGESKNHWPTLGLNTLKWAKAQGAICGPAHSSAGLQPSQQRVEGRDGPPLPGWKGRGRRPVTNLPNHFIPRYNGIGANEYIVDITHRVPGPDGKLVRAIDFISSMNTDRVAEWNMWYHTLNCGFRVKTSGETDFPCVTGDRVGIGRVYVKVKDRLTYDDWCQGLTDGRSYVSDGSAHLIDLTAQHGKDVIALGEKGSELRLDGNGTIKLKVKASIRQPARKQFDVELIHNGYPVQRKSIPANGTTQDIEFSVNVKRSGWLAVRAGASAHTNPIFVVVDGKPIRASVASAEWCLKGVDQCWKSKQPTYAKAEQADAKAAYDHARKTYQRILEETRVAVGAAKQ